MKNIPIDPVAVWKKKKRERETWREENDFWINYIDEISNLFGYFDLLILDFNWLQSNCDLETEKGGTMHKQIALLRANQIARITSDFKMDLIDLYIYWYYLRLPLKLIDYISFSFQGFFYWSEKSSQE